MTFQQPAPVILVDSSGNAYSASGSGGGGSVNISQVGGNAVTTAVPVSLASSPLPTGAAQDATFTQSVNGPTSLSALNAVASYAPGRKGTTIVQVTGTFVATLSLLGSVDNTNFVQFGATPQFLNLNTGAYTATITAPGIYQTSSNGMVAAQIKATAYTSGTAVVTISSTDGPAMVALDASIPTGANTIGNVGIVGGGTGASVKTSGTAAQSTDTTLVVGINPNTPLPAGTNYLGNVVLRDGAGNVSTFKTASTGAAAGDNALVVTPSPNYVVSSNGYNVVSTASAYTTTIKSSAGSLMQVDLTNTSGATVYLKLFNKASAPTLGTDIPVLTIPVAAGGASITEFGSYGKRFNVGIAAAITGAMSSTDTTAIAAGVLLGSTYL